MSDTLRKARGKLEWYLDEIASLHPNDYKRELDAVIGAAIGVGAPEITEAMVERAARATRDELEDRRMGMDDIDEDVKVEMCESLARAAFRAALAAARGGE